LAHDKWRLIPASDEAAELSRRSNLSPLEAEFLCAFVDGPDRREAWLADGPPVFPGPEALPGLDEASEQVEKAILSSRKILVHGDYDVDGLMGAAVLCGGFGALGAEASAFIPSRFEGGYGLSEASLKAVKDEGAQLLVTADCGTNAREVGSELVSMGCGLVVTDHHVAQPGLAPPGIIVNPQLQDGDSELKDLCGASVAYLLLRAVQRRMGRELPEEPFLRLLAIATVADVVAMSSLNRRICKAGFKALETTPNPGIALLLSRCAAENGVTSHHVGFYLAPRFNAAGRIEDARLVLDLMLERDPAEAARMVGRLEALNETRRKLQASAYEEASRAAGDEGLPVVFAASASWHKGVVGPVAARLAGEKKRSAFVVAIEDGIGTGSARAFGEDNVTERLRAASDILDRFGGHAGAAGFTVSTDKLAALENRLQDGAPPPERGKPRGYYPLEASRLHEAWLALSRLDPLGPDAKEPYIGLRNVASSGPRLVNGRHLFWDVRLAAGSSARMIAWDGAASGWGRDSVSPGSTVIGRLIPELRRGNGPYYFQVADILP
jgi:single-stranded-DNA-specific exonuclease